MPGQGHDDIDGGTANAFAVPPFRFIRVVRSEIMAAWTLHRRLAAVSSAVLSHSVLASPAPPGL